MSSSNNNTQRRQKGLISEVDIASLLTKYSAPTILALLQEVAQFPGVKIDWNVLVKKITTGITNAWEYQMLWRHLAYCHKLVETVDEKLEDAPLQDDDSDLEYELEAYPPTDEASLESAACVKVLLASGLSDDAGGGLATVEAPLTINIPTWQDFKSPSDNPLPCCLKGMNITVPVSVQKQSSSTAVTTAEGFDGTVSNAGSQPVKRKRKTWKAWTAEEDNQLIAGVKKFGEGNWSNILKADFKGDRTASQLSQRWSTIRKGNNVNSKRRRQLATNRAISFALNMPMYNVNSKRRRRSGNQPELTAQQLATNRAVSFALNMPMYNSLSASSVVPNPMVRAAAVAAGARIASPSTAKSLLKAAESKTAVHITSTEISSMPGVHYISTGLSSASPTTYSTLVPGVSPPPSTPAVKSKVPSIRVLASASTLCGMVAAGKKTNRVTSARVGNTLEEEKAQSSHKEVVKNSSNEEKVKNTSMEEQVKPVEMIIDCSADIVKDDKQDDQDSSSFARFRYGYRRSNYAES